MLSIPLYRLVQFQLEREVCQAEELPEPLNHGRVLAAVYRISTPVPGAKQGLALRLMVNPKRRAAAVDETRATA
jgi:hypothetical protein